MNNFKNKLSKQTNFFIVAIVFLLKLSSGYAQSPCACNNVNSSSNPCPPVHYPDLNSAQTGPQNITQINPPLDFSVAGTEYVFCTRYTPAPGETTVGVLNYFKTQTGLDFSRISYQAFANGCTNPIVGTVQNLGAGVPGGAAEFIVTPGIEYKFCVTLHLNTNTPGSVIENVEFYTYNATPPPSGCSSTIGTVSVTGATANGSEWDLSPGGTISMSASGYVLPSNGGVSPCTATYGYVVYDQAPTLPLSIGTFSTLPGFKGIATGTTCTDDNNAGLSSSVATANKLWFVPLTADCKNGGGTPLDVDADGDLCYAFGNSAIVVNYLASTPCGSCTNPVCPIYLTPSPSAGIAATYPVGNRITENAVGPTTVTECHTVTVVNANQTLGFRQGINQINQGCATRTYTLYATDVNGHCTGLAISPTRAVGPYSQIFNPEWDNLPAGNYVMCITQTLSAGCDIDYITTGYYLLNLPAPPCPTDQSFIALDWAQTNPFVPFPSTTYTCSSGPQTIWKNVESTIGTPGELQAFPGFQMSISTNANSDTKTSALVSVNGTPYSYYGPTGTAPAGVLDWGPMGTANHEIIEPYIPAGATVTVQIKDLRAGAQSFPYTVYDHSTGALLASGTATPNASTPITVTFTLSSPTMTWKLDGGNANIVDNHNGSATFNPSNLTSGAHTITYTWTNNSGCSISATQNINVGPTTVAPTTSPIAYCQNETTSALTATASAGCTLNWYGTNSTGGTASSTGPTPNSTTAGATTYYVSQTNTGTGCESPRATLVVTINSNPTLTITAPAAVCMPSTIDITNANVTAGSSAGTTLSYWIDPTATTPLPVPTSISNSGTYYIKALAGTCKDIKPVTVLINNCSCPYAIVVTNPTAVCAPLTIDITQPAVTAGSTGGGTLSYFTDAACLTTLNTPSAITTSGTYYIKGDNGVCNDTKPVIVTINTTPSLSITDPSAKCFPLTIDITSSAITTGSTGNGTLSYYLDNAATNPLNNPNAIANSGTFYIQSANGNCKDIKPVNVTINSLPTSPNPSFDSYCQNDPTSPLATVASAGCTLNWYTTATGGTASSTTPTVSSSTVGITSYYTSQTNTLTGCESALPRTQIDVDIKPIPTVTLNPLSICEGETASLFALGAANTFSWASSTTQNISTANPYVFTPTTSDAYTVTVTLNGCSATATAVVTVKPSPILVYKDTLAICTPGTIDLTETSNSTGSTPNSQIGFYSDNTYLTNLTGESYITLGGTYYIQSLLNGCKSNKDSVIVIIREKPKVNFNPDPAIVNTNNTESKMINTTTGAQSYSWNFGDGVSSIETNPTHTFPNKDTATFVVTLTAVSDKGCIDSVQKIITVVEELIYYIPNTFTPNNDEHNSLFTPVFTSGYDKDGYELLIFNRWGDLVFQSTEVNKGWDGKLMNTNEKVQDGTYTWKILYSIKSDDRKQTIVGHVNVLSGSK